MDRTIPAPDIHTTSGKLADLDRRMGKRSRQVPRLLSRSSTPRGKKTARERVMMLLDPDSFTELDEFARHRSDARSAWRSADPTATVSSPASAPSTDGRCACSART